MTGRLGSMWRSRAFAGLVLAAACAIPAQRQGRAGDFDVDLALVLAIDCSFSVDAGEFRLQMEGLGRAFMRPEVKKAIQSGPRQRIAVTAMQWSDENNQLTVLPWTIIAGGADADEVGMIFAATPRRLAQGGTSISAALMYGQSLFSSAPSAERRVIDMSSDGRNNIGPPAAMARNKVVAKGTTINGLVILNEWATLDTYFENHVVGGPDHFVMPANDYEAYGEAIFHKLLREITGPGIS